MECSHKSETTLPDGSYITSICTNKAEILNGEFAGLCYYCAYLKLQSASDALRRNNLDLASQLRSAKGIITQREQEKTALQSANDEQKEALGKPHKCEGCDEMIYYQDYCTRCKRQWES